MNEQIHVVCGHCDSVVGLPERSLEGCAALPEMPPSALFAGKPIELTAANFDKHVGRSDLPLVVDFWAPWCGPCIAMAPYYEASASALEPEFRFAKLNTQDEPAPASRFNIRSIPTMIVFRGGKEAARHTGAMDSAAISRWLKSV